VYRKLQTNEEIETIASGSIRTASKIGPSELDKNESGPSGLVVAAACGTLFDAIGERVEALLDDESERCVFAIWKRLAGLTETRERKDQNDPVCGRQAKKSSVTAESRSTRCMEVPIPAMAELGI
jgi:hypothetical protein